MSSYQWLEQRRSKRQQHCFNRQSGSNTSSRHLERGTNDRGRMMERPTLSLESSFVVNATLLASGAIAGALEFITHLTVSHMKTPPAFHAFIDASVVSLMTIALVGVCIASVKARRRAMIEQIRIASDLNHHLRNALQVITQRHYLPEEKQGQAVLKSLDRIDEALKRLTEAH
jgi:hypothetical protein